MKYTGVLYTMVIHQEKEVALKNRRLGWGGQEKMMEVRRTLFEVT